MRKIVDHLQRNVHYHYPPQKIISLCPAITKTLYALKLDSQIIGRTKYCLYPQHKVNNAVIVGGTKNINLQLIQSLQPDLIIAEKEENTKEIVETLEKYFPVYVAEVQSIDGAYKMMKSVGDITGKKEESEMLISSIKAKFQTLPNAQGKRVAYVIWKKPYMAVGNHTYIHSLLNKLGFINPFASLEGRYPIITEQQFQDANLDYVFLATEPFPFKETHLHEFLQMVPNSQPIIVNGEMFWYGATMINIAQYFQTLFYQDLTI